MTANAQKGCQASTADGAADLATEVLSALLLFFTIVRGRPGLDLLEESKLAGHGEVDQARVLASPGKLAMLWQALQEERMVLAAWLISALAGLVSLLQKVHVALASDNASGEGGGRAGRGNSGNEGQNRCESFMVESLERGCSIVGLARCFSSLIAFKIVRRKPREDIEMCDVGGAKSTPALTLKLSFDSHRAKSVQNVFNFLNDLSGVWKQPLVQFFSLLLSVFLFLAAEGFKEFKTSQKCTGVKPRDAVKVEINCAASLLLEQTKSGLQSFGTVLSC